MGLLEEILPCCAGCFEGVAGGTPASRAAAAKCSATLGALQEGLTTEALVLITRGAGAQSLGDAGGSAPCSGRFSAAAELRGVTLAEGMLQVHAVAPARAAQNERSFARSANSGEQLFDMAGAQVQLCGCSVAVLTRQACVGAVTMASTAAQAKEVARVDMAMTDVEAASAIAAALCLATAGAIPSRGRAGMRALPEALEPLKRPATEAPASPATPRGSKAKAESLEAHKKTLRELKESRMRLQEQSVERQRSRSEGPASRRQASPSPVGLRVPSRFTRNRTPPPTRGRTGFVSDTSTPGCRAPSADSAAGHGAASLPRTPPGVSRSAQFAQRAQENFSSSSIANATELDRDRKRIMRQLEDAEALTKALQRLGRPM
eukprot:TRINITY_DN23676_c0_g3_i1.p1 TRINITY_DN23676_c0_g3~~TRINITY_DN23676_c0_g3_i1.p1  ORF type:complete len:405 (+),score=75.83 TRINITY_DN23676_c0_g3_i1:85-1215(+)